MQISVVDPIATANKIATSAHAGQFRRDGVTPYIRHPERVAEMVAFLHPGNTNAIIAAFLHDVLEDSDYTEAELLYSGIPAEAVQAVSILTKEDGERYSDYLKRVKGNEIAKIVKLADMTANLSDDPTPRQVAKYKKGLQFLLEKESALQSYSPFEDPPEYHESFS